VLKIEERPKIRFRSREGFCLASLVVFWSMKEAVNLAAPYAYFFLVLTLIGGKDTGVWVSVISSAATC
jgi:hypothetical protein